MYYASAFKQKGKILIKTNFEFNKVHSGILPTKLIINGALTDPEI